MNVIKDWWLQKVLYIYMYHNNVIMNNLHTMHEIDSCPQEVYILYYKNGHGHEFGISTQTEATHPAWLNNTHGYLTHGHHTKPKYCNRYWTAWVTIITIYYNHYISIYILVEPFLSARKLLLQHVCDRCETQDYYGAPHWECHKGVDRRRVAAPVESVARFPSLTENDAMSFVGLQTANTRFWIIVPLQKARIRRSRYLASSTADVAA